MAFVRTHRWALLDSGRRAASRFRGWRALTPQQRADRYVAHLAPAVITASLGGHPPRF